MKSSIFYILLAIMLAITSCKSDKDRMEEIEMEWQGRKIRIPSDLVFTIQNDTVDYDVDDCDYKILHYVDSIGCTACKLTLPAWEQFMGEVMTNQDISVKLLLVVNTSNPLEVRKNLRKYHFQYPIALDVENLFSNMNDLGEDHSSLTFLLNDNNEVVLVGNPLRDDVVLKSFRKELHLLQKDNHSSIKVTPENLPMGAFSPMETKRSKFRIFNNGSTAIKIEDIYTSCDCTSAWTDQDTIHPASPIDVYVECKANEDDIYFIRYVYITLSNNETLSLPLCGFVTRRNDELRQPQY